MSVSQISVFVESKPGHLSRVLDGFESNDINVRGFSASDTGGFGIVRFVVDKPDEALAYLKAKGIAARKSEVLCVKLADRPGELMKVLQAMARCNLNVVYCYSLASTYIVLSVIDVAAAEAALAGEPIELVNQEEISRFMTGQSM